MAMSGLAMWRRLGARPAAVAAAVGFLATAASATDIDSGFAGKPETLQTWNACQADEKSLTFEQADGRDFMRMTIDGATSDKKCPESCEAGKADIEASDLGRSLIFEELKPLDTTKCPSPELDAKGEPINQRNELRPRNDAGGCHPADAPHWYRIAWRIAEDESEKIPSCGSIRWVLAQWKYGFAPDDANGSPFLAQRFDNGVFHITVEDGFCRCMIAKSEGDPDRKIMKAAGLQEVAPLRCRDDEKECAPAKLKVYALHPAALTALPDPRKGWVEMTYRVSADAMTGTQFDVYANGQFIVRAAGARSGSIGFPNMIKFKFGHYRDKYDAKASLLVDRVCISESKDDCAKDVASPD